MPEKERFIKEEIQQVIGISRKGRRKVIALVKKKHPDLGAYKIRRVYEKYGFSLYKKYRKRIRHIPANPIEIPFSENQEWAIDFMRDSLYNGCKVRTLNIIDHYNRVCKGIVISGNFPAVRVVRELEKVIEKYGKPKGIRTDNGPEFISNIFRKWLSDNAIEHVRIQKGKPQQNAVIERFNRTYREDVLDSEIFANIHHAQEITDNWVKEYNSERPHESLNNKTPFEYAA